MDSGRILRTARQRAGLTLRQLAERAGTSDGTISAYERGRVTPRFDTVVRILTAAGWSMAGDLNRLPERDPRRASAGDELWQALLLAEKLPSRARADLPQRPHAAFAPASHRSGGRLLEAGSS